MQNSSKNHLILASAFILLLAAPACLADLMCYVCDDCTKLEKDTPLLACNEDFFNQGGSTEASTVTTTTSSTTEEPTSSSSTDATPTLVTEPSTTTTTTTTTSEPPTTATEESTTMEASTDQTTPESTEAPMPTPPTAGPPDTTPGVPTPPAENLQHQLNTTRLLQTDRSGNPMPAVSANPSSTDLPIRQRRASIDTSISYHCYSVQKTINNTVLTERGCSRVEPMQSVCAELQAQNNSTQLSQCDPCTMNACNGASAALQSSLLATLLVAVVAAALQRN